MLQKLKRILLYSSSLIAVTTSCLTPAAYVYGKEIGAKEDLEDIFSFQIEMNENDTGSWNIERLNLIETVFDQVWSAVFRESVDQTFYAPWVYDISGNRFYEHQQMNVSISPCGVVNTAHYCGRDGNIYIDMAALNQLDQSFGDAVPIYVVAHEYGHAVQHSLGIIEGLSAKRAELQADCFAGLMFAVLEGQGYLEENDIQEVENAAEFFGDYNYTSPGHHGTPIERKAHFLSGYQDQASCFVE